MPVYLICIAMILRLTRSDYADQRYLTWSKSEKAIIRKAFDAALQRDLH